MVVFRKAWSWNSDPDLKPWHVTMFWIFTAASFALAAWLAWSTNTFLLRAERTEGTVVELVERTASGERGKTTTVYRPKVRFEVPGAGVQEMEMGLQSGAPSYKLGDKVAVAYEFANPQNADIEDFWSLWFSSVVAAAIGVMFLVIALLLRRALHARKNEAAP